MLFPPNFSWPSIDEDEVTLTKEVSSVVLLVCPECDHEAVVELESANALCGVCFKEGNHIDMIALGTD